ncbi:MAG: 50S ribosomal protein L5 [Methanocalculus sp. MSAO_Arc1]|uniref:50S ribosomal protein L5 n=1 Tax=Methanocalculus TaxID=71151 RepID=UPI000FF2DA60|nr:MULTISPECIES: 50S ribosomal protein L5 [unclassified Methanocalculus]MCP1662991.1 large subunit ribosomal protein L5 [Methanocalculus sp. AMF5]RQD80632.1 MAG: 50S ribosomal protein L5 [Methanocalculus sp. MSAO_Arc1]
MTGMQELYVDKVVVHMSVGEAGEKLIKGETLMQEICGGATSVRTIAKRTVPAFGLRKGQALGCKLTLRGDKAEQFLRTALDIVERKIDSHRFDENGNFAFGIEEHTDFPGQSYDPQIGIYGMDVNVVIEKKGIRIARRAAQQKKLPSKQHVKKDEAVSFVEEHFNVEVVE